MPGALRRFVITSVLCLPFAFLFVNRMQAWHRFDDEGAWYTIVCTAAFAALGGAFVSLALKLFGWVTSSRGGAG